MIEQEYLVVMDFSNKSLRIIELTADEEFESSKYEDFGEFVETLQEKYGFDYENSQWMLTETPRNELQTFVYKGGHEVSNGRIDEEIYNLN